jgi:hypothetical protein
VQVRVEVGLDQVDVADQLAETLQRVVLALDRDQHLLGRDEGVDGEETQARRAVDEDVVQPGQPVLPAVHGIGVERLHQPGLAGDDRHELDLGAGQVDRRRHAEEPLEPLDLGDHFGHRPALDQHVVDRGDVGVVVDAERRGRVALGVQIDHEDLGAVQSERGSEVHRRRGLADAALLVGNRHDPSPVRPGQRAAVAAAEHAHGRGGRLGDRRVVRFPMRLCGVRERCCLVCGEGCFT